jgi:diguanylate cyclase (GGDEF)-like protein/PAS domain S-box-containing protein
MSDTDNSVEGFFLAHDAFQTLFNNAPLPMWVYDRETLGFLAVNDAAVLFYGHSREQFLSKTIFDIRPVDDRDELREIIDLGGYEFEDRSWRHRKANGTTIDANVYTQAVTYEGRAGALVTMIDVTKRRQAEARISHMAHHDAMTGLANRFLLQLSLNDALVRVRYGGRIALLCIDLDRFKEVNDSLGHALGDELLRIVSKRLRGCVREGDTVARLGGDEFAIVQCGIDGPDDAGALADRILKAISEPFDIKGYTVKIAASIGIALAPDHAADAETILKVADVALYQAKSAGRDGYCFFDQEMSESARVRRELERDLRHAIQHGELEVHYQPIVDARTRRICGAEALARWRHPAKGMILPDRFIPLAEETGLITQIGEWVLRTACIDAATWPDGVKVSVNLSARQFSNDNLASVVICALAESGLPPERLELEVTETALIESAAECLRTLSQLKNLGVTVALDDFGTGYSSFSQLTMFPFDKIKIDKSFTQNMVERADCAAIVHATLILAQGLGMETTAEGVETIEQSQLLRLAGATSLQGYLFKRPCPVSEIDFDEVHGSDGIEDAA